MLEKESERESLTMTYEVHMLNLLSNPYRKSLIYEICMHVIDILMSMATYFSLGEFDVIAFIATSTNFNMNEAIESVDTRTHVRTHMPSI